MHHSRTSTAKTSPADAVISFRYPHMSMPHGLVLACALAVLGCHVLASPGPNMCQDCMRAWAGWGMAPAQPVLFRHCLSTVDNSIHLAAIFDFVVHHPHAPPPRQPRGH
jgi:hypothetical protein